MQTNNSIFNSLFYYNAFGSILASEIELPSLSNCEPVEPDTIIILGNVPTEIGEVLVSRKYMKMGINFFWLSIPDAGTYYVKNGDPIIIEANPNADPRLIRTYLYSFCIPAFLFFSNRLPLHGSSLNINGNGVLLTGKSGAGKSTLASYFIKIGHPFVSDDLTVIKFQDCGLPMAYSSTPHQNLCGDTVRRLKREKVSDFSYRGFGSRVKFAVKVPTYSDKPVPLRIIVELIPSESESPKIRKVYGAEKMQLILQNTYRGFMIKGLRIGAWHFQVCFKLSEQIVCYKIERPKIGYWEDELYQFIMKEIDKYQFEG